MQHFTFQEMLSFFPENFPQKDALKAYLKNFYTFLPVHGLDTSIWKKVFVQSNYLRKNMKIIGISFAALLARHPK